MTWRCLVTWPWPWGIVEKVLLRCVGNLPIDFPAGQQPDGYAGRNRPGPGGAAPADSMRVETATALATALLDFAVVGRP